MMGILTFEKWLEANQDDFLVDEIMCEKCRGSGEEECRHCGSVIDCKTCGGTGKMQLDTERVLDRQAAVKVYNAQIKRDRELLARLAG